MTKYQKIESLINSDKELLKNIKNSSCEIDTFINNAQRYIKAIKENRMACIIVSVAPSGMSRNLKFIEANPKKGAYSCFYNFYSLFKCLGFRDVNDAFRVSGCGMDMIFHTNYTIIHYLGRLGFLAKNEVKVLCQKTPNCL